MSQNPCLYFLCLYKLTFHQLLTHPLPNKIGSAVRPKKRSNSWWSMAKVSANLRHSSKPMHGSTSPVQQQKSFGAWVWSPKLPDWRTSPLWKHQHQTKRGLLRPKNSLAYQLITTGPWFEKSAGRTFQKMKEMCPAGGDSSQILRHLQRQATHFLGARD